MLIHIRRLIPLLVLVLILQALTTPAPAFSQGPNDKSASLAEIQEAIKNDGNARVLVYMNLPLVPFGDLPSDEAVAAQQTTIQAAQTEVLSQLSGQYTTSVRYQYIPSMAMSVDATALQDLLNSPLVSNIELDRLSAPSLWYSSHMIGASTGWNMGYDGKGWTVAILDTGVDKTHPFLTGKVVSEACYAVSGWPGSTSLCPGGSLATTAVGSGIDCPVSITGCGHGTHVAGIAAGKNGTFTESGQVRNFSGVAKNANIIAIQVFQQFTSASDCGSAPTPCALTFNSAWIQGLERVYALRNTYNIASVNMSLGGGSFGAVCSSPTAEAAINNLLSAKIATVVANGNNGFKSSISSPACLPNVIRVGATDKLDNVASYSNAASFMSFWAPGSSILSSTNSTYANFNGTSMAAPQVAGVWAVLKQQNPTATVSDVTTLLNNTGISVQDYRSGGTVVKNRVQLDNALQDLTGTLTNDAKANARVLPDQPWYSLAHTMKGSTTVGTDVKPTCIGGSETYNNTVWFAITPTVSGSMTLSTEFSNFDTILNVYQGSSEVACNDEIEFGVNSKSRVTFSATAGLQYHIMVSKWGTSLSTTSNPFVQLILKRNMSKPTLVTPNVVVNSLTPTYKWNHMPSAEAYQLLVTDLTTMTNVINAAYTSESLCSAGVCEITHGTGLVNNRGYAWYIAAYRADTGWGPYSDAKTFIASLPLVSAPTQSAPNGIVTGTLTPTYSWTSVTGAVSYYVVIYDLETLTLKHFVSVDATTGCSGGTCSTTPGGSGGTLLNGRTYGWYVAALNYAGAGPWSVGKAFIPFVTPGVPTTVSPSGTAGSNPTYTWNKVQGATFYYLTSVRGGVTVVGEWVAASTVCGASTCSRTTGINHIPGAYTWYVLASNPAGTSAYSTGRNFTVGGSAPDAAPTFVPDTAPAFNP